jgi:glutamyl-tRNA reductase
MATGANVMVAGGGNAMAADKRTSVRLSEKLLRKARKTLKASTNEEAVAKALNESLTNREIHASLKNLIRKGRGRFVDVYD